MVDSCGRRSIDRPGHGEAADARIEDTDRGGVHGIRKGSARRAPLGPPATAAVEIAGKVPQMGRDVRLDRRKQVIEPDEHQPVVRSSRFLAALRSGRRR